MLNMDPPQHVKFRRIVQRGFTPQMIAKQEAHIRELAKRIVDAVAPRGECEFVEELAAELPLQVICEMMGVPLEDRKLIFELSNNADRLRRSGVPDEPTRTRMRASTQMFVYAMKLAERYEGRAADDLTTALLPHEVDGEKLTSSSSARSSCCSASPATRPRAPSPRNGLQALLEHPDAAARSSCANPRARAAVEEILRFDPAVHYFRRTATEDTELRGQRSARARRWRCGTRRRTATRTSSPTPIAST